MTQYKIIKKVKVEGKAHLFQVESIASGKVETFKVFENQEKNALIQDLENWVGETVTLYINGEWINKAELFQAQEPTPTKKEYEEEVKSKVKGLEGARGGMIINNAVQIAIAEFQKNGQDHVNLSRITGIARALDVMFPENDNS